MTIINTKNIYMKKTAAITGSPQGKVGLIWGVSHLNQHIFDGMKANI